MTTLDLLCVALCLVLVKAQNGNAAPKISLTKLFIKSGPILNTVSETDNKTKDIKLLENCLTNPTISLISYNRDGFRPNGTSQTELIYGPETQNDGLGVVVMAPFAAIIQIECQASVPIQWIFESPSEPEVISVDVFRETDLPPTDGNYRKGQNCFQSVVTLVTRKRSTGKYRCRLIRDDVQDVEVNNQSAWWYLFGEINSPPFLLYHNREFVVTQQESSKTVVLPCQVTNPTMIPDLYKGNSQVLAIQNSVPYDPQIGFMLDLQKIPKAFDNYKCSRGGSVYLSVKPTPAYRATPSSERLTVVEGTPQKLVCEGTSRVSFQGFIDDSKVIVIDDGNAPVYKYKVIYEHYMDGKYTTPGISCVDFMTKANFHTWHITAISEEVDKQSGINYDSESQRFYCHSKTEDVPTIALAQCSSYMECQLTDKCFNWDAPYKMISVNSCYSEDGIERGTSCKEEDRRRLNTSTGCAYIENRQYSGSVHCALPDNDERVKMYFFNGLQSGVDKVISDWSIASSAELVNIDILEQNRTFYTHESIEFECRVPKFVFANGQIFRLKLNDGSLIIPNETIRHEDTRNDDTTGDDNLIIRISRLELHDPRIVGVVCMAPFWNQTDWMNNSVPLTLIASISPSIIESESFREYVGVTLGVNATITCEATGLPLPKVIWYRDGKISADQIQTVHDNGKSKFATLSFGHVDQDDDGEYVCKAINVAGTETKKLNLVVTQSKRFVYTALIIGIITVTIFLIIVMILWRKLRRNQALVRRLTEKEILEFREGDSGALRNSPDGYIRAQYLPYDKEYEINQDNLDIDEEILGKGEYGIVLKGTLRLNDSTKEVAVKTSRSTDGNHFKALLTELKMLTYIGWHDNVINLLGAVTRNLRDRDVYVVVEYCRLGDLESFLRDNRSCYLNQIVTERIDLNLAFSFDSMQSYQPLEYKMTTGDLISWSYQISSGMEYLANKKVIHGDLAARNILLTDDRTVKITDFGLSKHLYNGSNYISHSSHLNLPWKHCAPEILQFNSFSTQSDVWSLGVTLWEIFTLGETPYAGVMWSWDFITHLLQGNRMEKPSYANQGIYNVILKCWKNTPGDRISFEELRKYFHRLLHHWAEEEESIPEEVKLTNSQVTIFPTGNHYIVSPVNQQRAVHYAAVA